MSIAHFEKVHAQLGIDYTDGDGYSQNCALIALELAALLANEGIESHIVTIRGVKVDGSSNRATLIPKLYEGRVKWGAHVICVADGVVYDPMMPSPTMSWDEYIATAFDQDVELCDTI